MKFQGLQNLLIQAPPQQFQILEKLLQVFARDKSLKFAFVRGSIARNDYDRASDVDLVIGIDDTVFEAFVHSLDFLMEEHFNPVMPGWNDKIVPNFGGLGYVFLIPENGQIFQVDLYLIPASKLSNVKEIPKAKQVYASSDENLIDIKILLTDRNEKFMDEVRNTEKGKDFFLIEVMILSFLILKRIKRGQQLLNYSETFLLNTSLRNLFRLIFEPHYLDYGFYHFMEHNSYPDSVLDLKKIFINEVVTRSISTKCSLKSSLNLARKIVNADKTLLDKFSYSFEVFEKLFSEV